MVDIFIVDGQSADDVKLQLDKCRDSLRGCARSTVHTALSATSARGYSSSIGAELEDMGADDDANTGFALVINGQALVYALDPALEQLFLDVGTQCNSAFFLTILLKFFLN